MAAGVPPHSEEDPMAVSQFLSTPLIKLKKPADFSNRLINFKTGSAAPANEHLDWLLNLSRQTNTTREFWCHIYGFASKFGNHDLNLKLSYARAQAVAKFLENLNGLYTTRIDQFQAEGDDGKGAGGGSGQGIFESSDPNDPHNRAVEVHVGWGPDPGPPIHVTPVGPRTIRTGLKWSVANKSLGYQGNPVELNPLAQLAISAFGFRNDETNEIGTFIAIMSGVGTDALELLSFLKKLKELKNGGKALKLESEAIEKLVKILTTRGAKPFFKELILEIGPDLSFTPSDWNEAKVFLPMTLNKLDGATIANASIQPGMGSYGKLWVYGNTWYIDSSKKRMYGNRNFMEVKPSYNFQVQIPNLGAGFVGGALIRV
jgi:hypothetical protein